MKGWLFLAQRHYSLAKPYMWRTCFSNVHKMPYEVTVALMALPSEAFFIIVFGEPLTSTGTCTQSSSTDCPFREDAKWENKFTTLAPTAF